MATHHGRPGGRGLELLLLLAVLALTTAVLALMIYISLFLTMSLLEILPRGANGPAIFSLLLIACGLPASRSLRWLWRKFLGYYKYDPNSLKPLTKGPSDDRTHH